MEKNNNIYSEYREFLKADSVSVPKNLSENVLSYVHKELNPSAWAVLTKLGLIHFFVGAGTLAFCPQFGVSFTSSMGLMSYLMQYGESVCMLGCGALFLGVSLLVASLLLRPEEVRVVRTNSVVQLSILAVLSLAMLTLFGGTVVLNMGLIWVLGAILGGAISLQLGWYARRFVLIGA